MNKIRGTYWPSGERFLSVVSYLKRKTDKVPNEDCRRARYITFFLSFYFVL